MSALTLLDGPHMLDDVQVLDADRHPITTEQMRLMMGWVYGTDGEQLADLWAAFNRLLWGGKLEPVPLWMPTCTSWGRWIGLYTHNHSRSLSIQVKWQLAAEARAGVLLHEMVHQALAEAGKCTRHNAAPWCDEIMRISHELWGVRIWASPSNPTRVAGESVRRQKPSPSGEPSITRRQIASWPHSVGLRVNVHEVLIRAAANSEAGR